MNYITIKQLYYKERKKEKMKEGVVVVASPPALQRPARHPVQLTVGCVSELTQSGEDG